MKIRNSQKKAFTIVEFLLAMTFLATLLLGVATVTMRILDIYRKGLSLRAVNGTGRDILNDLTRTISGSPIMEGINPKTTDGDIGWEEVNEAYRPYFSEIYMSVQMNSDGAETTKQTQAGGIFCTGSYSYIWNTAPAIEKARNDSNYAASNLLKINGEYYKFARIPDKGRSVCQQRENSDEDYLARRNITLDDPNNNKVVSLISDDDSDLALYDFVILPATQNDKTGEIFYSGTFILGTMNGGVNILSNGNYCSGTEQMFSDEVEATSIGFDYCAVNKFNFAMRATGETSDTNQYGER